jgi:predicted nucleotidyltransferase
MIHNNSFEIMKQFLGDYNREIYGRELIGKVSLSQKGIALALDSLEKEGILSSRKSGNMKFFSLNHKYIRIKDAVVMAEIAQKTNFLNKHPAIANLFKSDERIVGIFGSYAKGNQKKDSDIDLFIIGEKTTNDYAVKAKVYDLNISIKYFSPKEFNDLLKKKNPLIREIIENHIILFNVERFIECLWRDYYGFD